MGNVANWEVASIDENGNLLTEGALSVGQVGTGSANNAVYDKNSIDASNAGSFTITAATKLTLTSDTNQVIITLPTSDPSLEGALWNNAGVVNVSAG